MKLKSGNIFFTLGIVLMMAFLSSTQPLKAQGKKRVIQLSGIILGDDSVSGIPGVHVYVPKAGRGTTSNRVGYFSLPVLPNDEITVSAVGYERQYFKVPQTDKDNLTIVIELISDTTYLETVEIMAFPTEEIFKEAIVALNLPIDQRGVSGDNYNDDLLALMLRTTPYDGALNYRYAQDLWAQNQANRFGAPPNPFLNPFNWAKFFKSLKSKKKN
ncbi:carboxypeptidase-like regulatory domain-containing protein [Fulvivirga sp. M361]|uniref:carboxypeptidase-like regulatory domain-containing protein n=1 Tax=Fulvivirga sp. M361 TaxID=2594266 RepID=UPI0021055A6A|nr:carboxypeptidase-like regulatory domain-containing protein [Fulvivirga sp. M361]